MPISKRSRPICDFAHEGSNLQSKMAAILDLKIFTNVINKCEDYQYFIGYFQNAFVSTLFKIIWKIYIFNVGHFGLRIAALLGKIQGGSWSIWNQRAKITLCTNFHAFIINLNNSTP